MTSQKKVRLGLMLFLLAAALGLTALPTQNAVAAPCCSSCDGRFNACLQGIYAPQCGGDFSCCDQATDSCYRYCSFSC